MVMGGNFDLRPVLKRMPRTLRVANVPGGDTEYILIQAAINYAATFATAAAPWTIYIYPGIYDEQIDMASWVNLVGIGPKGSVVIYQNDTNILDLADNVEIADLTLRLGTLTGTRYHIDDNAIACTARMTNLVFEATDPGTDDVLCFYLSGAGDYTIERCSHNIAGTGTSRTIYIAVAAATIHLIDNDFEFTNANAEHIFSSIACTITGGGNRWAGTGRMFDVALGTITLDGDTVVCPVASAVAAAATALLRQADDLYEVFPGMSIQDAVNALAAEGGMVFLRGSGTFTADAAQIARAIDDVTIRGMGVNTRLELDGVTAVISAGVQDGWLLTDFDTDAGLVDIAGATNSTLHNITINGLHATVINPDVGQTNFPGQPTIRTEEIRPLDPVATEIIKDFSRKEYQLYNPTFATPQFIMELLNRQARTLEVPLNDLWTDGSGGTGSSSLTPLIATLTTAAAANDHGLLYCIAAWLNDGGVAYDRVDWDNRLIFAFDVARDAGTHADLRGRVQLKEVNTEGVLADLGIGIEIQNFDIYGEAFHGGLATVDLGVTMTATHTYRVMVILVPGVSVDFWVNGQYKGRITTQVPDDLSNATCYWVLSMDNQAQAVASNMYASPLLVWNHL